MANAYLKKLKEAKADGLSTGLSYGEQFAIVGVPASAGLGL